MWVGGATHLLVCIDRQAVPAQALRACVAAVGGTVAQSRGIV